MTLSVLIHVFIISDGNGSWKACVKYVDDQFAAYFDGESGLNRKNIVDTRVHCCLYFIPPYGHGLRQMDLEFLKRLQYKVYLIPVIAKAVTFNLFCPIYITFVLSIFCLLALLMPSWVGGHSGPPKG